jgi:hypothetical protein
MRFSFFFCPVHNRAMHHPTTHAAASNASPSEPDWSPWTTPRMSTINESSTSIHCPFAALIHHPGYTKCHPPSTSDPSQERVANVPTSSDARHPSPIYAARLFFPANLALAASFPAPPSLPPKPAEIPTYAPRSAAEKKPGKKSPHNRAPLSHSPMRRQPRPEAERKIP